MLIRLRYAATCAECGARLQPGEEAKWYRSRQGTTVYGLTCHAQPQRAATPPPAPPADAPAVDDAPAAERWTITPAASAAPIHQFTTPAAPPAPPAPRAVSMSQVIQRNIDRTNARRTGRTAADILLDRLFAVGIDATNAPTQEPSR